jgi:Arc/MetJ family transcription regulator
MMYDRDAEMVIIQKAKGLRTTLNIDDKLLAEAERITGVSEKASLVRVGVRQPTQPDRGAVLAATSASGAGGH